jgi:hypothetical protein
LQISSVSTLALNSPNKVFIQYLTNLSNTCSSCLYNLSFV